MSSQTPWTDEAPREWERTYLGRLVDIRSGATPSKDEPSFWDGQIPWVSPKDMKVFRVSDSEDHVSERAIHVTALRRIEPGAVLMVTRGMILDHTVPVALTTAPVTLNQDMKALVPRPGTDSTFLAWLLIGLNPALLARVEEAGHGTKALRTEQWRKLPVALPPLELQRRIAATLDRRTTALDALIAKKERLLELLAEKRQALITRAVTKGLDPNAPMKDSGVEAIGQIPAGWSALPIRRLVTRIEQGWSPTADDRLADHGEWAVLKLGAVFRGQFRPEQQKALSPGTVPERRYEVHSGDLLVTRANTLSLVGDACVVEEAPPRLMLPDLIYRLSVRSDLVIPRFLAHFLLSNSGRAQIESDARGSSMSMAKVSGAHVRSWLVPVPPTIEDQERIVAHIRKELHRLDGLAQRAEAMVEKLREYRQAIITAAVTGKLDVTRKAA